MSTLTEHRSLTYHYFGDDDGNIHGEYKGWCDDGTQTVHALYVHGKRHGEYKSWYNDGDLSTHCIYVHGKRHDVPYIDILSDEDKFELCLIHGHMEFLPNT